MTVALNKFRNYMYRAILHQFTLITESLTALRAHPDRVYQPENLLAVWEAATRAVEGMFLDKNLKQIHLQHFDELFLQNLKNREKFFLDVWAYCSRLRQGTETYCISN